MTAIVWCLEWAAIDNEPGTLFTYTCPEIRQPSAPFFAFIVLSFAAALRLCVPQRPVDLPMVLVADMLNEFDESLGCAVTMIKFSRIHVLAENSHHRERIDVRSPTQLDSVSVSAVNHGNLSVVPVGFRRDKLCSVVPSGHKPAARWHHGA